MPVSPDNDPTVEFLTLVRSARELLVDHEMSGTWALPSERRGSSASDTSTEPAAREPARASAPPEPGPARPAPLPPSGEPRPPEAAPPALAANAELEVIRAEVAACQSCPLHSQRSNTVLSRGSGRSRLMFIGEGPGEEEDRQGLPFVGPAGQLLDRMIGAMNLDRDDVYVCNVVKCRPPKNRKPAPEEMARCMPYLDRQIAVMRPLVIVALGATAVQGLLGTTGGITRLRGQWKLYKGRIPVMPTFHPAYLLRQPRAKREVWNDLQQVLQQLAMPAPR